MLLNFQNKKPTWTILNEEGNTAIDFDAFLGFEFRGVNSVASEPIEQGGFADYNKQDSPKEMAVALAVSKPYEEQQPILDNLDTLSHGTQKVSLVTPSAEYKNLNIESYSYGRKDDSGAGMLVIELKLIEIREVEVKKTVTASEKPKTPSKPITKEQAKKPSNTSTAKTGRTRPQPPKRRSLLKHGMDGVRGVFSKV